MPTARLRGTRKATSLGLESIRIDGGTQSRATLNQSTIEDYADDMRAGVEFPSIIVFYDGKTYWLADGFHRWYAARKADLEKIACEVKQGTQRDAILFSVGANSDHGQRRTNADKRRAVELLLNDREWSKRSDRWIAEKCGVGHPFVGDVRHQVESDSTSTVSGRDGKQYPRQKATVEAQAAIVHEIPSDLDEVEWEPPTNGEPEESDEAPVTPIPTTQRRRQVDPQLSDLGKVADSIEAQIGLLIQECGEFTPAQHKAFNFSEGVKKLRFAEKILSEAKSLL